MNTDFEKQSGQRKPILLVSGVAVAVCLFVAALLERRRAAASAEAAHRRYVPATPVTPEAERTYASSDWAPAGPAGDPVWEQGGGDTQIDWLAAPVFDAEVEDVPFGADVVAEPVSDAEPADQSESQGELEPFGPIEASSEPHAEVEAWQTAPDAPTWDPTPEVDASVEHAAETESTNEPAPSFAVASEVEIADEAETWHEPNSETEGWHAAPDAEVAPQAEADPAPAPDQWFGAPAPVQAWQPESEAVEAEVHAPEVHEADAACRCCARRGRVRDRAAGNGRRARPGRGPEAPPASQAPPLHGHRR